MTSTQKTATSFLPSNEACDQKVEGGEKTVIGHQKNEPKATSQQQPERRRKNETK